MTTPPIEPQGTPQPGWYPDPEQPGLLRQWTGQQWGQATAKANARPRNVRFWPAGSMAFKGAFTYRGRSTAPEFWWFFLFNILVTVALYVMIIVTTPTDPMARMAGDIGGGPFFALLLLLWAVVSLVVQLPLTVRRLHDKDMTGWLVLLVFIPFASIVLLILLIGAGRPVPNRYGPVPT